MQYYETTVEVNKEYKTIKKGDAVIKDGIKYIFEWCTYQFERWIDTSRPTWCNQVNFEGGIGNVDKID